MEAVCSVLDHWPRKISEHPRMFVASGTVAVLRAVFPVSAYPYGMFTLRCSELQARLPEGCWLRLVAGGCVDALCGFAASCK